MAGKIKSIHGIYKKHGREAFLEAAAYYSDHVNPNSIDKTIDEMESRWYDATHRQTEAEKMVEDYNNGQTILNDPDLACTDNSNIHAITSIQYYSDNISSDTASRCEYRS